MKTHTSTKVFLVFDCAHTDSHNNFNIELIKQLKNNGSVVLFSWNDSYLNLRDNLVSVIFKKYLTTSTSSPFLSRVILTFNTLLNALYLRLFVIEGSKRFVLLNHEIISLGICSLLFPKGMYLIHHMQIDELRSSVKRFFFGFYKNRFVHVVMTDYIKSYLINCHRIRVDNIKVVPHPLYHCPDCERKVLSIERKFIALNYSGDENLIESLINIDSTSSVFANNGCSLVIKSKFFEYVSPGLRVFKGFLSKCEYDDLYNSADCVLSLLSESFKFRMSGTVADAISHRKPVIALRSACTEYFQSRFANAIFLCHDLDSLIKAILQFRSDTHLPYYATDAIVEYQAEYENRIFDSFE